MSDPTLPEPISLVITTTDTIENARAIASKLLEKNLAACVQIYPVESHYLWQGKVANDSEYALHIKTPASHFEALRILLCDIHTYDIPQIAQLDITAGHGPYLDWVRQSTA